MKTILTTTLKGLALAAILTGGSVSAWALDGELHSLRGMTTLQENADAADLNNKLVGERFEKNYRQQPPLVPHAISSYQIDIRVNQCIACHDWPQNVSAGAPKISETHYIGRDGNNLNKVASRRWFCTQCHVPQDDVKALVPNTFESSSDLE
ncbi:MAG: ferredoxin [Rhodospirillaceae bacterium]|nr:MAG: ferredoxin [Rhodospirillaceae bacterium]